MMHWNAERLVTPNKSFVPALSSVAIGRCFQALKQRKPEVQRGQDRIMTAKADSQSEP
jgi:hypothetical protein